MAAGRKDIVVTGFDLGKKTLLGLEDKNYSIAVAVQNQYKNGLRGCDGCRCCSKRWQQACTEAGKYRYPYGR